MILRIAICALAAAVLAGCSGPSGISTSALLSGDAQAKPGDVVATGNDPTSRAVQVGATAARARKCGFNFDPVRLKANFLAAEAGFGTPPDQLQKTEREYDYVFNRVATEIARDQGYCSEGRTRLVKADLGRHLAGDFSAPKNAAPKNDGGLFAGWGDGTGKEEKPFGYESVFDPHTGRPKNSY